MHLSDLHIHSGQGAPTSALVVEWSSLSSADADTRIREISRDLGRGPNYDGPASDDPLFEELSPGGQRWADARMIPNDVNA